MVTASYLDRAVSRGSEEGVTLTDLDDRAGRSRAIGSVLVEVSPTCSTNKNQCQSNHRATCRTSSGFPVAVPNGGKEGERLEISMVCG